MTNYAIVDAVTRVLSRLTTDEPPSITADEIAVPVADDFLKSWPDGVPQKRAALKLLDDGTLVATTQAERDAALTPPIPPKNQAVIDAATKLVADPRLGPLATALIEFLTPKTPTE